MQKIRIKWELGQPSLVALLKIISITKSTIQKRRKRNMKTTPGRWMVTSREVLHPTPKPNNLKRKSH